MTSPPGDDDTALTCDGPSVEPACANAPEGLLYLCLLDLQPGAVVSGTFLDWGLEATQIQFLTSGGLQYDVWLDGSPEVVANIPNLAEAGTVRLTQLGDCDGESGFDNAVAVYRDTPAGELLLVTGSTEVEDLGGWTVRAPSDTQSCPACQQDEWCGLALHNRPVTVEDGSSSTTLYQGSSSLLGEYLIHVGRAQSGSGELTCADGGTEFTSWYIILAADVGG